MENNPTQQIPLKKKKAIFVALFVTVLWATSWVLIKFGLKDIPPILFVGLRYTLAFFCLLPFYAHLIIKKRVNPVNNTLALKLIFLGLLLYTITQGANYIGLSRLPAITTNLVSSFISLIVALLGIVLIKEKPAGIQWLGLVLVMIGTWVYFAGQPQKNLDWGAIFIVLGGVLAAALAVVLGRSINQHSGLHPLQITTLSMGSGGIALLLIGLTVEQMPTTWSLQSLLIILWLAVVNTAFAFTLWNWTMQSLTAVESSVINSAMQIEIPIMAVLFLNETLTWRTFLGLILAAMGIVVVQLGKTWMNKLHYHPTNLS
jgi:drug/metabolite transporter (DMT)-like permease